RRSCPTNLGGAKSSPQINESCEPLPKPFASHAYTIHLSQHSHPTRESSLSFRPLPLPGCCRCDFKKATSWSSRSDRSAAIPWRAFPLQLLPEIARFSSASFRGRASRQKIQDRSLCTADTSRPRSPILQWQDHHSRLRRFRRAMPCSDQLGTIGWTPAARRRSRSHSAKIIARFPCKMRSSSEARLVAARAASGGSRFSTTAISAPSEVGIGSVTSLECKSATAFLIIGKSGTLSGGGDAFGSNSSARENGGTFASFKFNFGAACAR